MPEVIVSGNLNLRGNTGRFETDRSTWGFGDTSHFQVTRSADYADDGLYSAKIKALTSQVIPTDGGFGVDSMGLFNCEVGKTYIVRAMVYIPIASPIAADTVTLTFHQFFSLPATEDSLITKTVAEAKGAWVQIEARLSNVSFTSNQTVVVGLLGSGAAEELIPDGLMYIDELEIFEYIIGDEGPPPEEEPEFNNAFLSKNPIMLNRGPVGGWDALVNYRHYCDVQVEQTPEAEDFVSVMEIILPPDSTGNAVFYLQQAFRKILTAVPPTLNQSALVRLTDRIKKFKTYTGDLTGVLTTPALTTESLVDVVLMGGIDKLHFPDLAYLTTYITANKKFLTWAPLIKQVDRQQEDYLNFWVYSNTISLITLRAKAYYDDDTDESNSLLTVYVRHGALYQVPAGPTNSGVMLINPAKNVVRYDLWLIDQDDAVITEVRTYKIDLVSHPRKRFFMFLNSLGSYEVLKFTGVAQKKTEFESSPVKKYLPHDYAAQDGEYEVNSAVMSPRVSYSSGYVTKDWFDYLKDFLLSTRVYDVTTGLRVPMTLIGRSHEEEDQDYQYFVRFEAKPSYDDNSYTPFTV
jgi:hypothetical protein